MPVQIAVWPDRGDATLVDAVGTQLLHSGENLPPLSNTTKKSEPPQTIISVPVQTAVWRVRGARTLVLVGVGEP